MSTEPLPRLTTAQAAARLGVKPETLYAYVSRGRIERARDEHGGSTFDPLDVEALAAAGPRRRSGASGAAASQGTPLMVLDSDLTVLRNDELFYRGLRATELADTTSFERAAELLWTGRSPGPASSTFEADPDAVVPARAAIAQLGPTAGVVDRLTVAVRVAASHDAHRHDLSPGSVQAIGRRMIACVVEAVSPIDRAAPGASPDRRSIAARLWPGLASTAHEGPDLPLLNAALVLGMDHDLAVSTLAARVAASARSDPYAAVTAALSAFDGPLHGAASGAAFEMLTEVIETGAPERALRRQLKAGRGTPGFGHLIYRERDPRAAALLARMRRTARYAQAVHAVDQLTAVVQPRLARPANLDLALAAFAAGSGMRGDAGQTVFAVARTAGWIAHVLDEYGRPPLRLRPQSRYVGVEPAPR